MSHGSVTESGTNKETIAAEYHAPLTMASTKEAKIRREQIKSIEIDRTNFSTSNESVSISNLAIMQLHVNTQHAKKDDMIRYIKRLNRWHPSLSEVIERMLQDCACKDAEGRRDKAVAVIKENRTAIISHVEIDIMYQDGVPCLHIVDRATTFSVATVSRSRLLSTQIQAFEIF